MTIRSFVLRFYVPLIVGVGLIVLGLSADFVIGPSGIPLEMSVGLPGLAVMIPLPAKIAEKWIPVLTFVSGGMAIVILGITTDFSKFFPKTFRIDVFFDIEGLQAVLNSFPQSALSAVHLDPEWHQRVQTYDCLVRDTLEELCKKVGANKHMLDTHLVNRATLHAHGKTTFKAERIGLLSYRIVESEGYLDHTVDTPKAEICYFRTEFSLRSTRHDHVRPHIRDLLRGHLLRPEFKQTLRVGAGVIEAKILDHTVIGMTKVRIIPFPSFSSTVYLWLQEDNRKTVPVAYAVYY